MPIYATCPHCGHPMIVPARARGKGRLCRQCGRGYRASTISAAVMPLAARSTGEMLRMARGQREPAFVLL